MYAKIMTLGDAVDIVQKDAAHHYDGTIPVGKILFHDLNAVDIDGVVFEMTASAQSRICSRYRIPIDYLRRCESGLQRANLNHWSIRERNANYFVRFRDNKVRAFFTERYKPVDHKHVIDRLLALGYYTSTRVRFAMDEGYMKLSVMGTEEFAYEGDGGLVPGVTIINSEVGYSALTVQAFLLRLVCTNGLTVMMNGGGYSRRHISEEVLNNLGETIKEVGNMSQDQITQMLDKAIAVKISTDDGAIQNLFDELDRRYHLTYAQSTAVYEGWKQEPRYNMWGIVNAYTRGAQNEMLTLEESNRLELVGGIILAGIK
jgi:hypothetical protein